MNSWILALFNLIILGTWIYLLYLVYTLDPKIQSEWKGSTPSWAAEYNSFIQSVKITSFINGGIVISTLIGIVLKQINTPAPLMTAGRRR